PKSLCAGNCWKFLVRQIRSLVSPGLIREMENSSRLISKDASSASLRARDALLEPPDLPAAGRLDTGIGAERLVLAGDLAAPEEDLAAPAGFSALGCDLEAERSEPADAVRSAAAFGSFSDLVLPAGGAGLSLALGEAGARLDLPVEDFEFLSSLFFMVEPPSKSRRLSALAYGFSPYAYAGQGHGKLQKIFRP